MIQPVTLQDLDEALAEIDRLDLDADHEAAHSIEDSVMRSVLATVLMSSGLSVNHRLMAQRLLDHLDRVDKGDVPRWAA